MPEAFNKYIPLSQLEGATIEVGKENKTTTMEFSPNLPSYVDTSKIGINVFAIHRRCRMAGIETIVFLGSAGETSSATPAIVGMSDDHTAIAAKAGTARIEPTFSSNSEGDKYKSLSLSELTWTDITVKMNTSETAERITERKKQLRSPEEWAKEINTALQESILKEGTKTLKGNLYAQLRALGYSAPWLIPPNNLRELTFFLANGTLLNGFIKLLGKVLGRDSTKFRWSTFYGVALDRILLLYAMTKKEKLLGSPHGTLVRELSPSESQ